MKLENTFTIAAPIEKAWEALNTPEMIAPCFPGATLTEYEGDTFVGTVKVKLGPISLTYKGKGTYKERDDTAHRVVIDASGRDSRGNGTANATVTGTMTADGPDKTAVSLVTDMTITGRPAQFGRGVISDVADKIITQFAACVAEKLAPEAEAPAAAAAAASSASTASSGTLAGGTATGGSATGGSANGSAGGGGTTTATAAGPVLKSPSPSAPSAGTAAKPVSAASSPMKSEVDAIDLLDHAGAPVLKRLAPVLGGALLLLIVLLIRRSRAS